jgi:hypothetical protein
MIDWQPFLEQWSRDLMKTKLAIRVEPQPDAPNWLGFKAATRRELRKMEKRLGVALPPSYLAFLQISNGWRRTSAFIGHVRSCEEVNWFRVENEQWAEVWSEGHCDLDDSHYYNYSKESQAFRPEHIPFLLQISDVEDGVYLLNPEVVTDDGEWEAWFLANWIPGPVRYPSFAHLMAAEYRSFLKVEKIKVESQAIPRLASPRPTAPRRPTIRIGQKKAAEAPDLLALIEQMRSLDEKTRRSAITTFFGKLRGRFSAQRRPDLVQPLVDLFRATPDPSVRCACVAGLTELAEGPEAPAPLLAALSDPVPDVVLQGIFALTHFPDIRAFEPLCRFVESDAHILMREGAIGHLGKMGDERAVPILAKILLDTKNEHNQTFDYTALALAGCGSKGFDVLAAAVGHEDARIRHAVAVGLDCSGDSRAGPYLDRLASDPDPQVRERAKQRIGDYHRRMMKD